MPRNRTRPPTKTPALPLWLPLLFLLPTTSTAFSLPSLYPLTKRAALPASSSSSSVNLVPGSTLVGDFVCKTTGECAPCPPGDLESPLCKIYGNRRPLICVNRLSHATPSSSSTTSPPPLDLDLDDDDNTNIPLAPPPIPIINSDLEPDDSDISHAVAESNSGLGGISDKPPLSPGSAAGVGSRPINPDEVDDLVEEAALDGLDPDPESLDDEDLQDALRGDGGSPGGGGGGGARAVKRTGKGVERRQVAGSRPSKGHEIHTWEACARVVKKERADFFEFVLCNLFFAAAAVVVLVYRHRALAARQYSRLAVRIGVQLEY